MSVLKARKETFEFSPEDIKKLICADLNVPEEKVTVSFKIEDTADDRFSRSPSYSMTRIEVTVDRT